MRAPRIRRRVWRARIVIAFSNHTVWRGRFWGAVVRPVKAGGEKDRDGGRRAPSDAMPRVKSQACDLRKRGDSIRRSTQNGTRDFSEMDVADEC